MGDLSREPSMEEILSSIKRIIAEEGEEAAKAVTKAPQSARDDVQAEDEGTVEEILELTDTVSEAPSVAAIPSAASALHDAAPADLSSDADAGDDGILSVESEVSARHSLAALSTMLVKPQPGEDNTLENLVRTMLRPMLKEWLDARLPALVQDMVAKEIARITAR
jgi:cell pole-organizing protein PopZ